MLSVSVDQHDLDQTDQHRISRTDKPQELPSDWPSVPKKRKQGRDPHLRKHYSKPARKTKLRSEQDSNPAEEQ